MNILSLGYLGVSAADPKQWLAFATDILGLMPARALPGEAWGTPATPGSGPASGGTGIADDGSVYLKMDDYQWRIAVHPTAGMPGIEYIGLELQGPQELQQAIAELKEKGVAVTMADASVAAARAVIELAYTEDPAGNRIELYHSPTRDFNFTSPQGMRFLGNELGLGHVNLFVDEVEQCQQFYSEVLGFRLTDFINFGPRMSSNFYHCNARHHSIGLTRVGEFNGLHHLMLEVEHSDDVGRCLDRVQAANIEIKSTLGRHKNDNMLSFYMSGPSGFEVEIGCEGVLVDDNWSPRQFVEGDIWGHHGLDPESIQKTAAEMEA